MYHANGTQAHPAPLFFPFPLFFVLGLRSCSSTLSVNSAPSSTPRISPLLSTRKTNLSQDIDRQAQANSTHVCAATSKPASCFPSNLSILLRNHPSFRFQKTHAVQPSGLTARAVGFGLVDIMRSRDQPRLNSLLQPTGTYSQLVARDDVDDHF